MGGDFGSGVYASGSTNYVATDGGLSMASETQPVPAPLPILGSAFALGYSRRLRSQTQRLRQAASNVCA